LSKHCVLPVPVTVAYHSIEAGGRGGGDGDEGRWKGGAREVVTIGQSWRLVNQLRLGWLKCNNSVGKTEFCLFLLFSSCFKP